MGKALQLALAGAVALGLAQLLIEVKKKRRYWLLQPRIDFNRSGRVQGIEAFGEYVVRQIGLDGNTQVAKRLAKGAEAFLRGDKSGSDDSLENLFNLIAKVCSPSSENRVDFVYEELLKELDLCLLSYFSFHWNQSALLLEQIIAGEKGSKGKLRKAVLTATRKQQYEQVVKSLNMQRVMSTLLEQLKRMGRRASMPDDKEVMIPADSRSRSPVLLLIGGGMGAGKSTAVKDVMQCPFWSHVASNAVVVEADAFKETDVIYRALNSLGHGDMVAAAQLVHESSTQAASSLLVAALNEGRDVIYDGTLSWEPFVLQTIAMVRDVHNRRYQMGPGYTRLADGTVHENYWEPMQPEEENDSATNSQGANRDSQEMKLGESDDQERKPYRIELVGVTCEAHLAVVRGMRRAILTGRGVPVGGQLKSHKLFSKSVEKYCDLVDHAKVFSTNAIGGPAELIAWKEGKSKLLMDNEAFTAVRQLTTLNPGATSIYQLYTACSDKAGQLQKWKDSLVSEERSQRQAVLRAHLLGYETTITDEN